MSILGKIFAKEGIKDASELKGEEREIYEQYKRILDKPEITIEDLKLWLKNQIRIIEAKWKDYNTEDKAALIPYHTIYRSLLDLIESQQTERETLEQYLAQLHKL